jgi:hypothetical protein
VRKRIHVLYGGIRQERTHAIKWTTFQQRKRRPDEFGIPAQYKEAIKFAALALAAQLQLANNIPAASGASRFAILGKLVAAPRLARGVGSMAQ